MVTTLRAGRSRPEIRPIRTTGPGHGPGAGHARVAFQSPAWAASPLSPASRPCLMYPGSDDERMREHDKAAVERLEPRSRLNSPSVEPARGDVSVKPTTESPLPTPLLFVQRAPLSAPLLPLPTPYRLSIAEETRNTSMYGPASVELGPSTGPMARRGSAPAGALRLRAMQSQRHREALRRRGLVNSHGMRVPDLFVMPAELKRLSTISNTNKDAAMLSPYPVDGRLTTRVIIHSPARKPVVLTRTFYLDELRATIPGCAPVSSVHPSGRASAMTPHSLTPLSSARIVSPKPTCAPIERRHSSSSFEVPGSPGHIHVSEKRSIRHRFGAAPMHLEYARTYLPVLAAIILSEIVRPGDTLELPLPHPRAWQDTVAYIYTGQTELTEPIRQNILYLGGRA